MLETCNRACVMEATSMASSKGRLDGTRFVVLIFTNLTQDHLDYHGTMEEYFEAKTQLFVSLGTMRKAGRAVVNADSEYGRRLISRLGGENAVLTYGVSLDAAVRASDVRVSADG